MEKLYGTWVWSIGLIQEELGRKSLLIAQKLQNHRADEMAKWIISQGIDCLIKTHHNWNKTEFGRTRIWLTLPTSRRYVYCEMQRKMDVYVRNHFMLGDISKEPGIVCITKPQVGFLSFFFFYIVDFYVILMFLSRL